MEMEDDCAGNSCMSKRLSESLAVIRALSNEHIQEFTDAKAALDISFANLFRNRMKLSSCSYPDRLCNATEPPSPSRDRVSSFTCRAEHEKNLKKEGEKKMRQINATYDSGHTVRMSKIPSVTDDDIMERCKEDQSEITEDVSKSIEGRLRLDVLPAEGQGCTEQSSAETVPSPTGISVNDTMMRNYLSHVQRIAPSAYVLDLLKHRLKDDITDINSTKKLQSASTEDGYSQPIGDHFGDPRKGSIGPANRRVVVIGQGPTVSPHPKKRFSTRTMLSERDIVMLKRRCVAN